MKREVYIWDCNNIHSCHLHLTIYKLEYCMWMCEEILRRYCFCVTAWIHKLWFLNSRHISEAVVNSDIIKQLEDLCNDGGEDVGNYCIAITVEKKVICTFIQHHTVSSEENTHDGQNDRKYNCILICAMNISCYLITCILL